MPCPHGINSNPERCSQCLGATPTIVRVVGTDLFCGDQNLGPVKERNKAVAEEFGQLGQARSLRTCGRCKLPGHYQSTCNNKPVEEDEEVN